MRRFVLFLVASVGSAACGSGDSGAGTSPPPPPPVQPGPPASLAIQAGNDQQGEPGRPLAVRPAVVVRDVSGRLVPNAAVTFAVDSGGGTISAGAASTDAAGLATAGEWALGPDEGRHTLTATTVGVGPVRFAATGRYAAVTVATSTVAPSGGIVTVDRPGSPINGLSIQVPDSAIQNSAAFSIDIRSSAGVTIEDPVVISRVAGRASSTTGRSAATAAAVPALLPLLTLQVVGPRVANRNISIRIPLPTGTTPNVLVAVLDSANRPVAFLPVVTATATSVTVTTRLFDWRLYAGVGAAPTAPTSTTFTLTLAVFKSKGPGTPLAQTLPTPYTGTFVVGTHNFEFRDVPTALEPKIDAGMVLAAYGGLWFYPNGINNRNARAVGVPLSNTRHIMLAAGLSRDFATWIGRNAGTYIAAYHASNPALYQWTIGTSLYYSMVYVRYPTPLLLTDGQNLRMVLVVGWDPGTSSFGIWDPAYGVIASLGWTSAGMAPYRDPYDPTITYTIPYFHHDMLSALWPQVWTGLQQVGTPYTVAEPYRAIWPAGDYSTWDVPRTFVDRYTNPDTIFMRGDTTRIWYTMPGFRIGFPTTLPVPAGEGLQSAEVYEWFPTSQRWLHNAAFSGPSTFLDVKKDGQAGRWLTRTFGMNLRMLEGTGKPDSWRGFRLIDVVKFAVNLNAASTGPRSARFTVQQPGGPLLPADGRYLWDFGDGSALVLVASPGTVTHTFPASGGPYQVTLTVQHAATNAVTLARAFTSYPPAVTQLTPKSATFLKDSVAAFAVVHQRTHPANARYRWTFAEGGRTDTVNVAGDSTVAYTFTRLGTYAVVVDVTDGAGTAIGRDSTSADVEEFVPAWKFTSLNVQFNVIQTASPGNPAQKICYACWRLDSLMWVRIQSGPNEAGLLHLATDSTISGQFGRQGLYVLEGTNITKARLTTHFDFGAPAFSGVAPAAGRITSHWLVDRHSPLRPSVDPTLSESYAEVGTTTNGSITGTSFVSALPLFNSTVWFPYNLRQANSVTFAGGLASGTLTYVYRLWNTPFVETWRSVVTITFTAQRVR